MVGLNACARVRSCLAEILHLRQICMDRCSKPTWLAKIDDLGLILTLESTLKLGYSVIEPFHVLKTCNYRHRSATEVTASPLRGSYIRATRYSAFLSVVSTTRYSWRLQVPPLDQCSIPVQSLFKQPRLVSHPTNQLSQLIAARSRASSTPSIQYVGPGHRPRSLLHHAQWHSLGSWRRPCQLHHLRVPRRAERLRLPSFSPLLSINDRALRTLHYRPDSLGLALQNLGLLGRERPRLHRRDHRVRRTNPILQQSMGKRRFHYPDRYAVTSSPTRTKTNKHRSTHHHRPRLLQRRNLRYDLPHVHLPPSPNSFIRI